MHPGLRSTSSKRTLRRVAATALALALAGSAAPAFAHDRDNNPPGHVGGPGTNWENRPGPRGGPGASPDRPPRR